MNCTLVSLDLPVVVKSAARSALLLSTAFWNLALSKASAPSLCRVRPICDRRVKPPLTPPAADPRIPRTDACMARAVASPCRAPALRLPAS